jgi:NADH-ubiquinone oxidoreductase chain 5
MGTDFFGNSLFIHPNNITMVEAEFSLPLYFKLLPTIGSVLAAFLALLLYNYKDMPKILIELTHAHLPFLPTAPQNNGH